MSLGSRDHSPLVHHMAEWMDGELRGVFDEGSEAPFLSVIPTGRRMNHTASGLGFSLFKERSNSLDQTILYWPFP